MKKNRFTIICKCGKPIVGFSPHHANQNLLIHQKASIKHKEILKLIKDGIPNCKISCYKCKEKGKDIKLRTYPTGGKWDPDELRCPECNHLGGRIEKRSP